MKNTTMRAVGIVPRQRHVAEVRHEHPEIVSPTQIKVRTLDVGICGTDREICTFVYGEPPANSEYLILGHEALGIVVDVAAEV
ncbi:MAG: alcohol dehydrogenase catalytic domain-containing protein, partial [Planctomycetota bacterium]